MRRHAVEETNLKALRLLCRRLRHSALDNSFKNKVRVACALVCRRSTPVAEARSGRALSYSVHHRGNTFRRERVSEGFYCVCLVRTTKRILATVTRAHLESA